MPKKLRKPRRPGRTTRPGHASIPPGGITDPGKIREAMAEVDTECMALLSDDPALGLANARLTAMAPCEIGGGRPLPVVMFEPRAMIAQTLPDGSGRELQVEAIIHAGFCRWWPLFAQFESLPEWSLRQTAAGVELWDHGGVWARGITELGGPWNDAAAQWGVVLVIYGFSTGARTPQTGRPPAAERAAQLRDARSKGLIAAAIIPWRPLSLPDLVKFTGPTYNPATGRFELGTGAGGVRMHWRLHTPGQAVHHGLIIGGQGLGKSNALRLILIEAMCSGRYIVWPADPAGTNNLDWAMHKDRWVATDVAETVRMLKAANQAIDARLASATDSRPPRQTHQDC